MAVRLAPDAAATRLGEQSRILLGRLLLEPGAVVSTDALADALWGDEERANRRNGVQAAVKARARRVSATPPTPAGHRQRRRRRTASSSDPLRIDAERFKLLAARGHALSPSTPRAARAMLERGAVAAGAAGCSASTPTRAWAAGHAARARRACATASRSTSTRRGSRSASTPSSRAALRRQIVEHPHDERRRGQLVRALMGAGRAAEAGWRTARPSATSADSARSCARSATASAAGFRRRATAAADRARSRRPSARRASCCAPLDLAGASAGRTTRARHAGAASSTATAASRARRRRAASIAAFDDADAALRAAARASPRLPAARRGRRSTSAAIVRARRPPRRPGPGALPAAGGRRASRPGARLGRRASSARAVAGAARSRRAALRGPRARRAACSSCASDDGEPFPPPHTLSRMAAQPARAADALRRARRRARRACRALVAGGELLTLIGAGGCGKTRLALQLAARCITRFRRRRLVRRARRARRPAPTSSRRGDGRATSSACARCRARRWPAALVRHLSDRAALLVLDNCEQVHAACGELVARLRTGCPDVCIVATSRRRLGVDGERVVAGAADAHARPTAPTAPCPTPSSCCSSARAPLPAERHERRHADRRRAHLPGARRACRWRSSSPRRRSRRAGWQGWPPRSRR